MGGEPRSNAHRAKPGTLRYLRQRGLKAVKMPAAVAVITQQHDLRLVDPVTNLTLRIADAPSGVRLDAPCQ
eukprot:1154712-Prorocentrum_lima.AAC.1